jgi:multidrug efflux pump subunit AcrB
MFSRFFIDRPIFAAVLSILITLAGALSAFTLPLAQFPRVTPPTVQVSCNYPGASARDVAEAVAAPIEKEVNGVEGMMYMSSSCANDGSYSLTVTFHQGVNLNMAQVLVQNRVSLAIPKLPDVIKQTGVTTLKRSPDIIMGIALNSPNGRYNQLYLSNYALRIIKDELTRVPGVSDVFLFGQRDFSMRLWVQPDRLAARNLTAADVVAAIREQNSAVASGTIGQQPAASGQDLAVALDTLGRLKSVEQFENIILRADSQGRLLRVKDVARVELGPKSQDVTCRLDGKETVFLAIFQLPDANALDTNQLVIDKMNDLQRSFPEGVTWEIGFTTVPYTQESLKEVLFTLRDAIILVAVVVLLFLQNWRSALIPLIAVPVAIIGTFAVMAAMGFSLNNLTMFGLVLSIGIVVDDAIVVVEAVEHHIDEGMAPREATIKAMDQVSGPVVAVGLVLSAVFIPCAFIGGITGLFFRQFALTISVSTVLSAFNSLTLSPALAALLLKRRDKSNAPPLPWPAYLAVGALFGYLFLPPALAAGLARLAARWPAAGSLPAWVAPAAAAVLGALVIGALSWPLNWALRWFFRGFNTGFRRTGRAYVSGVGGLIGSATPVLRLVLVVLAAWAACPSLTPGLAAWLASWLPPAAWTLARVTAATHAVAALLPGAPAWVAPGALLAVGALAGLLLGLPLKWLRGVPFRPLSRVLGFAVPSTVVVLATYAGLLGLTWWGFATTPRGFIPQQDMGYLMVTVQLPDAASTERTDQVMRRMEVIARADPGVWHATSIVGQSFALNATGSNFGSMFINLKPYPERREPFVTEDGKVLDLAADSIVNRLMIGFGTITDAMIQVFPPPPVRGVGRAGGFAFVVEDRGDLGAVPLQNEADNLIIKGNQKPGLMRLFTAYRANVPQLHVQPNARECESRGVKIDDVNNTLVVYQGSLYVNDFNLLGRTWQVIVQSDEQYRTTREQLYRLKVRSSRGGMVPLGSVVDVTERNGPLVLTRYNMYPAATIQGSTAPGVSSRQGIDIMEGLADQELPKALAYEWTDMSYLELQAGNTAMNLFACAVVAVFLVLAAQYESWSLPLAVILVVPMCLLSAVAGVQIAHHDINIFVQVGFVVLVGLASKNAILIVEFAKHSREEGGLSRREATLAACRLRLRPIVMTSVAFVLGVVPLLIGHGAGAEMRKTLGIAVFAGMIGVTLFGLFLTPVFFSVIDRVGGTRVFRSRVMQVLGSVTAGSLTLGLRRIVPAVWGRWRGDDGKD